VEFSGCKEKSGMYIEMLFRAGQLLGKVFQAGLTYKSVHSCVKLFFSKKLTIRPLVERAVHFETKTTERLGKIAGM
jgi:hypothetical protein